MAIARALAMQPKLMLLDAPTSALDPELADTVVFMDAGVVVETGKPADVGNPQRERTRAFLTNVL